MSRHSSFRLCRPYCEPLEDRCLLSALPLTAANAASLPAAYVQRPLSFEPNEGQTDSGVNFLARGSGYTVLVKPTEAVVDLAGARGAESVLRMDLLGANPTPPSSGVDALPGISSYFVGNDPSQWHTNIHTYAKVFYQNVYPGVDLVYYGNQGQLEYDFLLAPGADPANIRFTLQGCDGLHLDDQGNLVMHTAAGDVVEQAPVSYQPGAQAVASRYQIENDGSIGFAIGPYDASRPLIIDPVLNYSTLLGENSVGSSASAVTVDADGNVYVLGGISGTRVTPSEVFVTKLSAGHAQVVYSVFIAPLSGGTAIAADSAGNAYVTGVTSYSFLPATTGAFQTTLQGALDAFVIKLNPTGSSMVYSTYLGGNGSQNQGETRGQGIAVDTDGNAYVTGLTNAADFPRATPLQTNYGGGTNDAFVTKLNASGSALVWSTFLGGTDDDQATGIALDGSKNVLVTGLTHSTDFPTANPLQPHNAGQSDAFLAQIKADGSALAYSTYLGGTGADEAAGLTVDCSGNAYVTGDTTSNDFPTLNAYQPVNRGGFGDGFVTKVKADGTGLIYSTYLGGSGQDIPHAIAIDGNGEVFVTGNTASINYPLVHAVQRVYSGGLSAAFVTKLNALGTDLLFSTYLGGSGPPVTGASVPVQLFNSGQGVAVINGSDVYVAGTTTSSKFPTVGTPQVASSEPGSSGFVTEFLLNSTPFTPNQRFVMQLYADLLGRDADPSSLAFYSSALDRGQIGRLQITMNLQSSLEYQNRAVALAYVQVLRRGITDALTMSASVQFLRAGGTIEQLKANWYGTPEYFISQGGLTNDGFLTAVYRDVLGRAVDAPSRQAWLTALMQGTFSRAQIALALLASAERDAVLVRELYRDSLRREADPNGLNGFVNALQHGLRDETAMAVLVGTDEYFARA
jgi:hypothetical protein